MKLIVITTPHFFEYEARCIDLLFRAGLETLHLRKPGATVQEVEELLHRLPAAHLHRIVTHEHFQLAPAYGLKGIHLNRRNPQVPEGHRGHVSTSCHSLGEVVASKAVCRYVFLSPLYNSISKEGYAAGYSQEELQAAQSRGIIDRQVVALGGIDASRLAQVKSLGFGGAAVLGDVWQRSADQLVPHFETLLQRCNDIK